MSEKVPQQELRQTIPSSIDIVSEESSPQADEFFSLTMGVFLMALLIGYFKVSFISKLLQRRLRSRRRSICPCLNCRFFNNDSAYLKCAVHPHQVLQAEAINCSDHWPKDSHRFSQ